VDSSDIADGRRLQGMLVSESLRALLDFTLFVLKSCKMLDHRLAGGFVRDVLSTLIMII
jgi:hypothetical protein